MATPVIRWPQANLAIGRSRSLVKKPSPLTISIGSARAIGMDLAHLYVDGADPFRLEGFNLALQGLALGVGGKDRAEKRDQRGDMLLIHRGSSAILG